MMVLFKILKHLEQQGFYGALDIKFEAGRVVLIRKTETLKPALSDKGENHNEHR